MTKINEANQTYLKIKIKHLAQEPALIRLEWRKSRRRQNWRLHQQWLATNANRSEPAVLKREWEEPFLALRLDAHRKLVVRPEARAAQLAYAFLRGKRYAQTERARRPFRAPDWKRVAEIALKYGSYPNGTKKDAVLSELETWVNEDVAAAIAA